MERGGGESETRPTTAVHAVVYIFWLCCCCGRSAFGHRLKAGATSKVCQLTASLDTRHRLLLTGTPLQNTVRVYVYLRRGKRRVLGFCLPPFSLCCARFVRSFCPAAVRVGFNSVLSVLMFFLLVPAVFVRTVNTSFQRGVQLHTHFLTLPSTLPRTFRRACLPAPPGWCCSAILKQ